LKFRPKVLGTRTDNLMTEQTRDPDTILARYADGPAQLEAAIAGLTEADLDMAQTADTWTIRQIVHHVVDGDDIWKTGIKAALGNTSGTFTLQWYWDKPQGEWVESWDYAGRAIEPSLALFHANRDHIVQLLDQIPDAWERNIFIRWPDGQKAQITVGDIVEMQADHIMVHINDIRLIRQTHNL
jgi:uncharacterized damage-inducible protein DinB